MINTCTVTSVADKKTRQTVRRVCNLAKINAEIIVTGCSSEINPDIYKNMDDRIVVVPKSEIKNYMENCCNNQFDMVDCVKFLSSDGFRTRASIKIQDGCDNNCTYCIVHVARGKSNSLNHNIVIEQVKRLLESGIKEIVLTGVNLAAYNDDGFKLADLCRELLVYLNQYEPARIRISSVEPINIDDDFIQVLKEADGKICRHLHMPLQSGSTKVLSEMDRHYNSNEFLNIVNKLKANVPEISLSTDVIVGFPGETDDDFNQTLDLCKKSGFMKIHVFPYSMREGTVAAARKDQVPDNIKHERSKILRDLSDDLACQDLKSRAGSSEFVICENEKFARTESYHQINIPEGAKPGDLIEIVL